MARILIADVPESFELCRVALATHDLWFASTLADAESLLSDETFDLLLVSLQFSESEGFELLRLVRATKELPVIVIQGRKNRVTDYLIATAGRCAKLLGAFDFIDLSRCPDEHEAQTIIAMSCEKCLQEREFFVRSKPSTYLRFEEEKCSTEKYM